ncbi:unannotated protein [freshwater metagenome]|uniref:Unannotated protein n=1 Tax=freshwater metagenome TaxID=449393 RepID=A0A6J7EUR3_9ZZZZ
MTEFRRSRTRRGLPGLLALTTAIAVFVTGCGSSPDSDAGASAGAVSAGAKGAIAGSKLALSKSLALPTCVPEAAPATIALANAATTALATAVSASSTSGPGPSASTSAQPPAIDSASPSASASASGSPSASVTASSSAPCPAVPRGLRAQPGISKISVSWEAPDPGAPAVTSYVITLSPGDRVVQVAAGRNGTTIAALDNGVEYSLTIRAVNEVGMSEASQPVLATPTLGEEPEVQRLIVAYEPGVPTAEAPGRATGSDAVADVALFPDKPLGIGMRTVEISEAVNEDTARAISAELTADPRVKWAQPDYFVPVLAATFPDDPRYASGEMWGLNGAYGIHAPEAWAVTRGSPSVVVAVLDTGITVHQDLAGQTVGGYDMIVDTAVSNDGDGRDADPADPGDWESTYTSSWHGTHVAGTIAAIANNGEGVAGVAPSVKVQPVRVLGTGGGYTSDIVAGITWASGGAITGIPANPTPARVISMSLGGGSACSIAEQTAITAAIARGTVIVVAAGNSNADTAGFTPASCSGVIAVAAVGNNGKRASFSNYGSLVDIAAPGVGILSTLNSGATTPSTPSYASYSGTSMATPHVSGVVALMISQNPSLSPAQVEARIKAAGMYTPFPGGVCDPDPAKTCGVGIINAGALLSGGSTTVPVTGVTVSPTSVSLNVGQSQSLSASIAPSNATTPAVTWASSSASIASVSATGVVTAIAAGSATITVTTTDGGIAASSAVTVTSTVTATGVTLSPSTVALTPGQTQTLSAAVLPSTATNKSVTWATSSDQVATVSTSGIVTAVAEGSATITARTADGGFTASSSVAVRKAAQTITFSPPTSLTRAQSPYTLGASSSSGLPVVFTSSTTTTCTVSGSALSVVAAGTCTVTAAQAGDAAWSPATLTKSITVTKAAQTITFTAPTSLMGLPPSYTLSATGSSSLPVTFTASPSAVCTVSGTTLRPVSSGNCSVTASQSGSTTYASATPVTRSISITKVATLTVLASSAGSVRVATAVTLSATVTPAFGGKFAGMTVKFFSRTSTTRAWTQIGSALTDSSGVAQAKPSFSTAATYSLMAEVQGSGLYTASQGTTQITATK